MLKCSALFEARRHIFLLEFQFVVFTEMKKAIERKLAKAFYVNGGPGRGKTFLLSTLASYVRGTG